MIGGKLAFHWGESRDVVNNFRRVGEKKVKFISCYVSRPSNKLLEKIIFH
jgi:hypothetical protein